MMKYLILIQFKYFLKMEKMDIEKEGTSAMVAEVAPVKEQNQLYTLLQQIRDTVTLLDKAITNKQTRTISRLTKNVRKYRNVISAHHVIALCESLGQEVPAFLRTSSTLKPQYNEKIQFNKNLVNRITKTLQLQSFFKILLVQICWRDGNLDECLKNVEDLINKITNANRRNLDNYNSLLYYYYSRIHEKRNLDQSIREILLQALNRSCVRADEIGQSTIFNLLLRNYLRYNHIEAAYNLIEKCSFPQSKSSNEFCKYLYYTGKVKAIRREYGQALDMLNQAIRKSPDAANGFKITCQKAAIVVELLLGQIPNREIFSDTSIFTHVYPYYKLIQVVLEGQLSNFNKVVELYKDTFQKDGLYTMILRLNQIVIRIGLRRISLAYSRISLADIGKKLNIPNDDVEFVVAKALRDGIMHGVIDHEQKLIKIEGDENIYVTNEPQLNLDKRIKYCLNLYHEVQKAITYPDMKQNLQEFKQEQVDASELLNLLDFDDDM